MRELVITNGYDQWNGGAIYMYGGAAKLTLFECVIHDNYAGFTGGAIGLRYGPSAFLTGCTFYDNLSGGEGDDVYFTHTMFDAPGNFSTKPCTRLDGTAPAALSCCPRVWVCSTKPTRPPCFVLPPRFFALMSHARPFAPQAPRARRPLTAASTRSNPTR